MVNEKGEALYSSVTEAFRKARDEKTGRVHTGLLASAASTLLPVYEYIFGDNLVSTTLKADLTHSSSCVLAAYEKDPKERKNVESFIESELYERGHNAVRFDRYSGIRNLLWLKRALHFVYFFLYNMSIRPEFKHLQAKDAALETYNTILKPYHGCMVANIVQLAFQLCPTKEEIQRRLGFDDSSVVHDRICGMVSVLKPVVDEVSRYLESWDCNFPDKA